MRIAKAKWLAYKIVYKNKIIGLILLVMVVNFTKTSLLFFFAYYTVLFYLKKFVPSSTRLPIRGYSALTSDVNVEEVFGRGRQEISRPVLWYYHRINWEKPQYSQPKF